MIISLIAAVAENNVIGKNNKLPWYLPEDLKYFKRITDGHHVIMGRGTYESLGNALSGRTNIIITRQKDYDAPQCIIVGDLKSAFTYAEEHDEAEVFVLGGGDVFSQALSWADKIYITRIFHSFPGDTFFPEFSSAEWILISEERHDADTRNKYSFAFQVYEYIKR
jgi:dihydrofolate reductase